MNITVGKVSQKQINTKNGTFNKYGIQTTNSDEWINIVDWDNLYDKKGISKGDELNISEPEKGDYGFEAKFMTGPTGFSDDEVQEWEQGEIKGQVSEILNYVKQIGAALEIKLKDEDGYPNPTKKQTESLGGTDPVEEYNKTQGDESLDDINW